METQQKYRLGMIFIKIVKEALSPAGMSSLDAACSTMYDFEYFQNSELRNATGIRL